MLEQVVSGLVIATGLVSSGVGVVSAATRLRQAGRVRRRTTMTFEARPAEWSSWFLGGFSGMAMGAQGLWATIVWVGWTAAGLCLIGLGLRLSW